MWLIIFATLFLSTLVLMTYDARCMVIGGILIFMWTVFPILMVRDDVNTYVVSSETTKVEVYYSRKDGYFHLTKNMDKVEITEYKFKKHGHSLKIERKKKQKNKLLDKVVPDYSDYEYYIIKKDVIFIQ